MLCAPSTTWTSPVPAPGGTFSPNGRFTMPRSYVGAFVLNVTATVVQTDGLFEFTDPTNPNGHFRVKVDSRFWDWSSNVWTLDWIIEESAYHYLPDPTFHPMYFSLDYTTYGPSVIPTVKFYPFGLIFPDNHLYQLPPAPPDYWMSPIP